MYFGLGDLQLYAYGILFLVASFFTWFVPGWVMLGLVSWKQVALKAVLALPVGLALFGLQGYVFGYLGLRWLSFVFVALFAVRFFSEQHRSKWEEFLALGKILRSVPVWLVLAIAASAFFQIFAQVSSGLRVPEGIAFYFVNTADGIMHLSYIQELIQRFPPQEPGAIGQPLLNYHYWSDLVMADLIRLWPLPIMHVFFQYVPILLAAWTMLLVVALIRYLGGKSKTIMVALFLFAFGGDAAYLITLVLHGTWAEKMASLDSGITFFFNTPQAFARLIFLGAVLLLLEFWKKHSWKIGLLACLAIASLFGFKVYYAIYAVLGFCVLVTFEFCQAFWQYARKHMLFSAVRYTFVQQKIPILLVGILAALSLSIYLPTNSGAGGLRYSFFEWPRRFLSAENIDYADWFLRMQVYEAAGNTRNIVIFNLWALFLTFVAVYGTRMLGMIPLFAARGNEWRRFLVLILPVNLLFLCLGLLTLQTSGGLNVFNFLIVPIVSFNILAAFSLAQLPTKIFIPVFALFILLTLPRSGMQFWDYAGRYARAKSDLIITNDDLAAFEYLQRATPSTAVVQGLVTDPQNRLSLYIPFFSNRDSYIAGITMLNSHNQPTEERITHLSGAFSEALPTQQATALRELGIDYLYIQREHPFTLLFEPVYQNDSVIVVKVPEE